ncbi:FHA domain-containing protein [Agromyces cerinus]|uniref:FHA domain-containing protein n=1 Tax=Agromyces cerinus subsp. cerinus TaxID=232089 RepID=A0A1N6HER1_9MICO|nr:FHA domain-containing protein [Agromyces cerinus]SIO18321.1 FHA domain-containing protein [Agromyces cerinus subsp. cerinus]
MVSGAVSSSASAGAPAWDVIVGDRFIAAVAAPAPQGVLDALSDAASDDRLALEALVGLLPSGRVDPVASFGLVWWAEGATTSVTAVVRGDAVVDLASPGGSRRFDARGIRPWHLADFDDVVALRITDAATPLGREPTAGEPVVPRRASLRASSVEWTAAGRPADVPVPTPWLDADTLLAPRQHEAGLGAPVADTVITPRQAARVSGATASSPTGPGAATEESPSGSPATPADVAGEPAQNGPRFRIGAGQPVTITAPVLIGRKPLPPRIAGSDMQPELLTVESPAAIVSGTHLELRLIGTRLVATDLHSTNGTVLRTMSGTRRLRAGESVVVLPGTRLDLGDDTIIEILLAQGSPGA